MTRPGVLSSRAALLMSLCVAALAGCQVDPFCLDCVDRDTGPTVDAGAPMDAARDAPEPDADLDAPATMTDAYSLPDGCTLGAPELCNAFDDDCDLMVDEGIDTNTDERNCGGCGRLCAPPNAFAECLAGVCEMGDCAVGYYDLNTDDTDGCEYRCVASSDRELRCDRRDEDCDGNVDEDFDLLTDVANCGSCGRNCRVPRGTSSCVAGSCELSACDTGYIDLDGVATNGCEYRCTPASPATETCNLVDDDCDGTVDEGDPGGGGSCGIDTGECSRGTERCVAGSITCTGGVSATTELCNGLDDDCDGTADQGNPEGGRSCGSTVGTCVPGRETCVAGALSCTGGTVARAELCNGLDDDCDGTIDQGNPEGGAACGVDTGECMAGTVTCSGGGLNCVGSTGPRLDTCNGLDDDCDGTADQTFSLMTDPRNCGMCGRVCAYPNAVAGCTGGACRMVVCRPGYIDRNMSDVDGCEVMCTFTGAEACNGVDDDCDGMIDNGLTVPATFCNPNGVCGGTMATCTGAGGWACTYPAATYQATETRCDGLDNDCDGRVDETFPTRGSSCTNGQIGACNRTGMVVCNAAGDGVVCNAPTGIMGTAETCNGIDDDCDGTLDDSPANAWVPITGAFGTHYIFAYEASRPNASPTAPGTMTHGACSTANRIPWSTVTPVQAAAACAGVGARLCTEAEWQRACETTAAPACTYSYGATCTTYAGATCNGRDYSAASDAVITTGSATSCYANWGSMANRIYDMTGNLQEWTQPRAAGINPMRGGSFNDIRGGLTCQYSFEVGGNTVAVPNTGFRCCRDTAP